MGMMLGSMSPVTAWVLPTPIVPCPPNLGPPVGRFSTVSRFPRRASNSARRERGSTPTNLAAARFRPASTIGTIRPSAVWKAAPTPDLIAAAAIPVWVEWAILRAEQQVAMVPLEAGTPEAGTPVVEAGTVTAADMG